MSVNPQGDRVFRQLIKVQAELEKLVLEAKLAGTSNAAVSTMYTEMITGRPGYAGDSSTLQTAFGTVYTSEWSWVTP